MSHCSLLPAEWTLLTNRLYSNGGKCCTQLAPVFCIINSIGGERASSLWMCMEDRYSVLLLFLENIQAFGDTCFNKSPCCSFFQLELKQFVINSACKWKWIVNYFECFFKQNYQMFPPSSSRGNFLPFSILLHVITNFYLWFWAVV